MENKFLIGSLFSAMTFMQLFQVQASGKSPVNSNRYTYLGTKEHLKDGRVMSVSMATALASAGYFVYSLTDKNLWYGSSLTPFAKTGGAGLLVFLAALMTFKTSIDCSMKISAENVTTGQLANRLDEAEKKLSKQQIILHVK